MNYPELLISYYFIVVTCILPCEAVFNGYAVPTESSRGCETSSTLTLNSSTLGINLQDYKPDHP